MEFRVQGLGYLGPGIAPWPCSGDWGKGIKGNKKSFQD